jgi:hypothetical protein
MITYSLQNLRCLKSKRGHGWSGPLETIKTSGLGCYGIGSGSVDGPKGLRGWVALKGIGDCAVGPGCSGLSRETQKGIGWHNIWAMWKMS